MDGIAFHSAKEARRFQALSLLLIAGEIRNLERQPRLTLNTWHVDHSECPLVGVYVGDFRYEERAVMPRLMQTPTWQEVIEDVKGFKTPLYKWKKKHVEAQYGIVIKET